MGDYYNIINTTAEEAEKRGLEKGLKRGLERGREEGREEGRVEGREQGRKEEKIELAKKFKSLGVDTSTIIQATGLSADVIESL